MNFFSPKHESGEDLEAILQARLAKTRQLFLDVLKDREAEIAGARQDVEAGSCAIDEGMGEIRAVYHKIAGSAGSLGFAEFGTLCKTLEERIDTLRAQGHTDPQGWSIVAGDCDVFRDEAFAILNAG